MVTDPAVPVSGTVLVREISLTKPEGMGNEEFARQVAENRVENKLRAQYLLRENDTLKEELAANGETLASLKVDTTTGADAELVESLNESPLASEENFQALGKELDKLLLGIDRGQPDRFRKPTAYWGLWLGHYKKYFDDRKDLYSKYTAPGGAATVSSSFERAGDDLPYSTPSVEARAYTKTAKEAGSFSDWRPADDLDVNVYESLSPEAQSALDGWFNRFNQALYARQALYWRGLEDYQEDVAALKKAQKYGSARQRKIKQNQEQVDILREASYLSENIALKPQPKE
jgi:hypothetical protein